MARALAIVGIVGLMSALACAGSPRVSSPVTRSPVAEPTLYSEPWIWSDETGARARLADWRGRFVIVTLVYTSCTTTCPLTIEKLVRIDARLKAEGRTAAFVLVTLDPVHDSSPELLRFKIEHRLPASWRLLRGEREQTQRLADRLGIRVLDLADEGHIVHDSRIVLVDPEGRILGQLSS